MSFQAHGELIPIGGGDNIPLIREKLVVGRRESCDICLRYGNVSGQHAELTFSDGYWYIRDLNSTNGIKVNGSRVTRKMLHPNDEITLAKRRFTIRYELPVDRRASMEDMEEDILGQSLLEKAGLERRKRPEPSGSDDPEDVLFEDDED